MLSLTYVSRVTHWDTICRDTMEDIQAVSLTRNSALNITGVLIATTAHFAQVIEGQDDAVNDVMSRIRRDPRHCDIVMLKQGKTRIRRFSTWQVVVFDQRKFESLSVSDLLSCLHVGGDDQALARFSRLLDALGRTKTAQ